MTNGEDGVRNLAAAAGPRRARVPLPRRCRVRGPESDPQTDARLERLGPRVQIPPPFPSVPRRSRRRIAARTTWDCGQNTRSVLGRRSSYQITKCPRYFGPTRIGPGSKSLVAAGRGVGPRAGVTACFPHSHGRFFDDGSRPRTGSSLPMFRRRIGRVEIARLLRLSGDDGLPLRRPLRAHTSLDSPGGYLQAEG